MSDTRRAVPLNDEPGVERSSLLCSARHLWIRGTLYVRLCHSDAR